MTYVAVYGFGSYFTNHALSGDIDLLLIHENTSDESCGLAIKCKKKFMDEVLMSHITMLSLSEEQDFEFIAKANAYYIGIICHKSVDRDINEILQRIALPVRVV